MVRLLNSANKFVFLDLHEFSENSNRLMNNLIDLSSDINNKSRSLNFLFSPFRFLNSKLGSDSPFGDESTTRSETIPQVIKWIVSGIFLIKTTKEFIKKYEKRK